MTKILSIDGGGIRGIVPGTILTYLENKLQELSNNPNARISDYFDLIAGTSTGGILTLALLCPDSEGRAKYSAKEAVDFYLKSGTEIFSIPIRKRICTIGGLLDEKYPKYNIEKKFEEYFGNTKLSELIKPCLITSYNTQKREEVFFNQNDNKEDYFIKHIARATSAAPTYFEPAYIKSINGEYQPFIDGGVFANNPAMCAIVEITKFKPVPKLNEIFMLSIGTGRSRKNEKKYLYKKVKKLGLIGWVKPLIDIMMSSNSETVNYQIKKIFDNTGSSNNLFRLQTELINANLDMDNASQKNINNLVKDTELFISENKKTLDKIAERLVQK